MNYYHNNYYISAYFIHYKVIFDKFIDILSINEDKLIEYYTTYNITIDLFDQYNLSTYLTDKVTIDDIKNLKFILLYYLSIKILLPDDFNATIYKNLNKDLINLSDNYVISHYTYYGIKEKRRYK
jgi:hypothetical protein